MKTKQLLLSAITTTMMAAAIGQRATAQTLQVHQASGATTAFALDEKTTVKFRDDRVLLSSPSQTRDLAKADVLRFTYDVLCCDVNGDGKVDVADIATVIDVMAGNAVVSPAPGSAVVSPAPGSVVVSPAEADVNDDGAVNVADIAAIIDKMVELARRAVADVTSALPEAANGTIGEAFYIYRNDGSFNAFFREEIDSIAFSRYTADSLRYNKIASQVVYTPDSTYFIPLVAIDSVGFVQPETIVSDDVFPLTAEHSPYISNADTLQFTMSATAPVALRPKVGNIVVATADCDAFPYGIIARVESIKSVGNGLLYVCSKAYIEDVFEQLVVYTNGRIGEGDLTRRDGMRKVSFTETLWNEQWSSTITGGGTTTNLNVGDRATATVTVCKTLTTPFYFQLQLQNSLTTSVDFTAESTASIYKERQIGRTITAGKIPIPYTMGLLWLAPKLSLYGYFEEKGKVELKYGGHFNRTDLLSFTYTQRSWTFAHTPTTDAGTDVAQLSMEGSAEIGLKPQIDFSLNGQQAGFGLNARLGLKENINFVFDATHLRDGGLYDAMRDSYCRTTIPWSINVHANANIFSRYDGSQSEEGFATFSHTFAPNKEPQWGPDRYIFPLFADVEGKRQGEKATAKASVSRTTLLPVQVGFSLIDKDKNIVQTKYDGRSYRAGSTFSNYSCELSGLEGSEKYTVRPSVKLFGYDVLASPSAELERQEFPVEITSFRQTNSTYKKDGFSHNGKTYSYQYEATVTVTLKDSRDVEDWGWVYCDPDGQEAYISLKSFSSPYPDSRYVFLRNKAKDTATVYPYVKMRGEERQTGEPHDYPLEHKGETSCPDENHPHWIDLGIGTLWRCCNEGASRPEEYGGYYQFGQVASAPTLDQIQALVNNCSYTWTTQNGVNGGKFTGPNGGTIFLPAAGGVWGGELHYVGSRGHYWSSTPFDEYGACGLDFYSGYADWGDYWDYGRFQLSVRPVR